MANDGGPAFPALEKIDEWKDDTGRYKEALLPTGGMSLRDYFAGQVVCGAVAGNAALIAVLAIGKDAGTGVTTNDETLARGAYKLADAMLKARET